MNLFALHCGLAQIAPAAPIEETVGVFDILQKGGILMWFILAASVVGLAIVFERLNYYRRCRMRVGEFLTGIISLIRKGRYPEAIERCDDGYGPVPNLVRTAILKRRLPVAELREVMKENMQLELPKLEANLALLATIGTIAPLFGLLGTVIGMIEAFMEVSNAAGTAPVSDLANGIWVALVTSAAGIAVAIPAFVAYNYLVSRLNDLLFDMERAAIEVLHAIADPPEEGIIHMPEVDPKTGSATS
ncbi:MAG: MotA/TolQ/ExbB proton channel family protein [Verrucomicrobiota bacterium]